MEDLTKEDEKSENIFASKETTNLSPSGSATQVSYSGTYSNGKYTASGTESENVQNPPQEQLTVEKKLSSLTPQAEMNQEKTNTQTMQKRKFEDVYKEEIMKRQRNLIYESERVTHPNCKTPFTSSRDVMDRLLPYHLFFDKKEKEDTIDWREKYSKDAERYKEKLKQLESTFEKFYTKMAQQSFEEEVLFLEKLRLLEEKILTDQLKKNVTPKFRGPAPTGERLQKLSQIPAFSNLKRPEQVYA